ncbi:transferase activity protein [Coemansia sp. RSA 2424]|nr:transferase activity protein [Coemansia sp. RSA 2424]
MSTYTLRHFQAPGRAEPCKAILEYTGAKWILETPQWPQEKINQPVGKLPVLVETNKDGTRFILSDSLAIEQYLVCKYNLCVPEQDRQMIARQTELRNQMNDLFQITQLIINVTEPTTRTNFIQRYMTLAKDIITYHEKFLKENGSNGHYFGNKTTYIDLAWIGTWQAIRTTFKTMPEMLEPFNKKNAPQMNNVLMTMEKEPKLAEYMDNCQC